ncbi:MAG: hypothetical protein GY797_19785 [Deltaproteobacteria bacterium]|nr:hypothetical protein [Deltaproteobacteria bacterium]
MALINSKELNKLKEEYQNTLHNQIGEYQLRQLNLLWQEAYSTIPYYRELKTQQKLPGVFESLEQYISEMPILTKTILQNPTILTYSRNRPIDYYRITGGSTASPIQIPAWKSERKSTHLVPWVGRSWYHIHPKDKLFLYWGHSHLLGSGIRGKLNGFIREIRDFFQNYVRYSCYNLDENSLKKAGWAIIKENPKYIIGYGYALDRLAKVNRELTSYLHKLKIKAVIGAAESFPFLDSEKAIHEVFNAPVGMEYGSVETGLIAHTHPDGGYKVVWKSYLLEYHNNGENKEVIVTSLFQRCTPLFRYKLGDLIKIRDFKQLTGKCSLLAFDCVQGRSNKSVKLPSGRSLHSETVTHIIRDQKKVIGYQFVCFSDRVQLNIILKDQPLDKEEQQIILNKAQKIDHELAENLTIVPVEKFEQTIAGKTPMVLYKFSLKN